MNAYRLMPYSDMGGGGIGLTDYSYNLSSTSSYDSSSYLNALRNINNRNLASLNGGGFNNNINNQSSQLISSGYITNPFQSNSTLQMNQRGGGMMNQQQQQPVYDELDLEFARIEAQTSRESMPARNELNSDLYVNRVRNVNNQMSRHQQPPPSYNNNNYMYHQSNFSDEQMTTNSNIINQQQPRTNKKTIKQIQLQQQSQQHAKKPPPPVEMDKETLRSILAPRLDPSINKKQQNQQQRSMNYSPPIQNRGAPTTMMLPPIMDYSQIQYDLTDFGYVHPNISPQYAYQPVAVPVPVPIPMWHNLDHPMYVNETYARLPPPPPTMSKNTKNKYNVVAGGVDSSFYDRLNKNEQHNNSSDQEEMGYADKFKDAKRRNEMDKKAHAHVVQGYKKFKESQGLGQDFLGKHSKETNEEKYEKMIKRNTYGNLVRDMNYQKQSEIQARKNGGGLLMQQPGAPVVAYYYANPANPVGGVTSLPNIRRLPTNNNNTNSTSSYQSNKTGQVKSKSNA